MRESLDPMREVLYALCKNVDSPFSLKVWLLYQHEPTALLGIRVQPLNYLTADSFHGDLVIASFIRKNKTLPKIGDLRDVAFQKFKTSEDNCARLNKAFRTYHASGFPGPVEAQLFEARRIIARVLGPFSQAKVSSQREWTSGANTDIKKVSAFPDIKLSQLPIPVTRTSIPLIRAELECDPNWMEALTGSYPSGLYSIVPSVLREILGGRYGTVPKDSESDRSIIVEPRANMLLQKGAGNFIRERLRLFGIDLNDQSTNQELARHAFAFGLSTVDLSSASDSIACELVYELLPYDWWAYLDSIRSKYVSKDGSFFRLEKFSSMGNGFTFELESLIFFALAKCVQRPESKDVVFVYGDDIIVPCESFPDLLALFTICGFSVNTEKTYVSGNYFESCGKHFFMGQDVTPIYQKEALDGVESIRLGNRLRRLSLRSRSPLIKTACRSAWHALRRLNKSTWHVFIPLGQEGDDGWLLDSTQLSLEGSNLNHGIPCRVLSLRRVELPAHSASLLAFSLRRGVKTETAFHDSVVKRAKFDVRVTSRRWVIPNEQFALTW